jgi:hypothetical protein
MCNRINELDRNIVYDIDRTLWRHLIHVADLSWWDNTWLLLLYKYTVEYNYLN